MATHQLAKGLASLGRHGDSMLMHVSPAEVSGLQALGQMTGHKLHINPNTGMPEAFDFGDFFSTLLPTLVGIGLSPATGGASLGLTGMTATAAPILGGMATGALVAGAKGQDVLGGALMGGLGGYGGGNLGSSLAKMGAQGGYQAGQLVGPQLTAEGGLSAAGSGQGMMTTLATQAPPSTFTGGLSQVGRGAQELLKTGGYDKFVSPEIGGSGMQLGAPLAMAGLSAMQPEPYDFAADEAKRKAEENKYRDPITGNLNLSASSGLNLGIPSFATGGTINTNRGTISGGGIQDLYGANDNTGTPPLSQDGYGLGRLNSLVSAGTNARAADEFYAQGGPVSFADGGDTGMNIDKLPSLNLNIISKPSESDSDQMPGVLGNMGRMGGTGLWGSYNTWGTGTPAPAEPTSYALNVNTGKQEPQYDPNQKTESIGGGGIYGGLGGLGYNPFTIGSIMGAGPQGMMGLGRSAPPEPKSYALNVNSGQQEPQFARGGYLNGAGDGMSDSIPATIEGKQPARLADGEFVVPADVVSHLGNGSSKAGSKQLYKMLDKVRKARTGHTKQGREINPNKYLPA